MIWTNPMLIDHGDIGFSQSGEQGIILQIFKLLGKETGLCCEFGAWDGIYLSNTRQLMLNGWHGLMIEADIERFRKLRETYPHETCVCTLVDAGANSLPKIAERAGITQRIDFVSIDIDGPDFEVFEAFRGFTEVPLVVCVEIHTCHRPDDTTPVPAEIAHDLVGQPFGRFVETASAMGYRLVCFSGTNAFFVHRDARHEAEIPTVTAWEAARQNLIRLKRNKSACESLYLTNLGRIRPFYKFENPMFSAESLDINPVRAAWLRFRRSKRPTAGRKRASDA